MPDDSVTCSKLSANRVGRRRACGVVTGKTRNQWHPRRLPAQPRQRRMHQRAFPIRRSGDAPFQGRRVQGRQRAGHRPFLVDGRKSLRCRRTADRARPGTFLSTPRWTGVADRDDRSSGLSGHNSASLLRPIVRHAPGSHDWTTGSVQGQSLSRRPSRGCSGPVNHRRPSVFLRGSPTPPSTASTLFVS